MMINENDLEKEMYPVRKNVEVPEFKSGMFYCEDLITSRDIKPLVGREKELYEIMEIISRKTNNCVLLVGPSGVGKTALVNELGRRLVEGKCPNNFNGTKLFMFNFQDYKNSYVDAQQKKYNSFEKRFMSTLAEHKNEIILFIDNFEQITKEYTLSSVGNLEDVIKPTLETNSVNIIGAITTDNYHKYIENNPSINNKLQKIFIDEISDDETISILRDRKETYEKYHNVTILEEAIDACVNFSNRYISDKCQPQKSLSLLDEACSHVKIEHESSPEDIERNISLEKRLQSEYDMLVKENTELSNAKAKDILKRLEEISKANNTLKNKVSKDGNNADEITSLKEKIKIKENELKEAVEEDNYGLSSKIKYKELPSLQDKLNKLLNKQGNYFKDTVTKEAVAKIVERKTGINVNQMFKEDKQKILSLKDEMAKRVYEQDEALNLVNSVILRSKAGVQDENKPLGSFLFLGPTGVGKTEIAKTIAEQLFDSEKALIRFDMSEYQDKTQIQRLVGSAPGYVGYEEGGQLTNAVKNKPYSVILFDEVEKAHPDIFNILLQVLDDGRLTDSKGDTIDFRNTLVIMTSNLGAENVDVKDDDERKDKYMKSAKSFFKPELLNRIDEIVVFNKLSEKAMYSIAGKFLNQLKERCKKNNNIELNYDKKVIEKIVKEGSNTSMGARPIKRYIQRYIEVPLSEFILQNDCENSTIKLVIVNNEFKVETD